MSKPWSCDRCGAEGTTGDDVAVVFHECRPPRRSRPRPIVVGSETREERVSALFAALAGAVGDDALLRR